MTTSARLWIRGTTQRGERTAVNLAHVARIDEGTNTATLSVARDGRLVVAAHVQGAGGMAQLQEAKLAVPGRWLRVRALDSSAGGGGGLVNLDVVGRATQSNDGDVTLEAPDGTYLGTATREDAAEQLPLVDLSG